MGDPKYGSRVHMHSGLARGVREVNFELDSFSYSFRSNLHEIGSFLFFENVKAFSVILK